MDTKAEIEQLKRQLNQLMKRTANPQPRPQIRRAKVVELGAYDCHKIEFVDGKFTKDLVTDDLSTEDRGETAYVGDDFDRIIRVQDKVFVSQCDGRWWIVAKDDQTCIGYCIDDPQDTAYVWGWYFLGPDLECCPEAGGPKMLTTSDSGSTYESATFQCNGTGDSRKWIWNGTKLYISSMLDEGNVQYQTDQTAANCTINLSKYEGRIFPIEECGPIPDSVCLHPLCGIPGCDDCDNGTPLIYQATFSASPTPNPMYSGGCGMNSPLLFVYTQNTSGNCTWATNIKNVSNAYGGPLSFSMNTAASPPSISCDYPYDYWEMEPGSTFDHYGTNVFTRSTSLTTCLGLPDTITVSPRLGQIVEGNCNPLVWRVITDDGFAAHTISDVICWEIPRFWVVEISGVTNDSCSDCDVFNGTFILDYFNGLIAGSDDITTSCSGSPFTVDFVTGSEGYPTPVFYIYLRFFYGPTDSDSYAIYKSTLASINCLGVNTLPLDSNTGECQNWPSEVTIKPLI